MLLKEWSLCVVRDWIQIMGSIFHVDILKNSSKMQHTVFVLLSAHALSSSIQYTPHLSALSDIGLWQKCIISLWSSIYCHLLNQWHHQKLANASATSARFWPHNHHHVDEEMHIDTYHPNWTKHRGHTYLSQKLVIWCLHLMDGIDGNCRTTPVPLGGATILSSNKDN